MPPPRIQLAGSMPSLPHSQYDTRYQSDPVSVHSPLSQYTHDGRDSNAVDSYYREPQAQSYMDNNPQADSWDSRSTTTYHSQAPLNPEYDMSQVSLRGRPSLNYQGVNYPPPPSPYTQPGLPYSRPTMPHSP
jgi:hypothetical protein